jgi:hypothetical protein
VLCTLCGARRWCRRACRRRRTRSAPLVWSACDKAALRRLVAGMCAARGTAQHIDTDSVRLRDELVRLLLHAGLA